MCYGALRALRTHAHCTRTYGRPEGSFPSGKKQRRICAAAMSGSAWTGVIMGGPSRKHSNLSGNKQNDSEARGKCGFERIIPKTRSKGWKRADRCGSVVIGRFRRKLGGLSERCNNGQSKADSSSDCRKERPLADSIGIERK